MTRSTATAPRGKAQRLATALVNHEVNELAKRKRKVLTVANIVKRYELDFGQYAYEGHPPLDVAGQVVRNALNKEFKAGEVAKLVGPDGTLKRARSGQIQFVFWAGQAHRLKGDCEWHVRPQG